MFGFLTSNAQEDAKTGGFAKGDFYVSGAIGFGSQESPGDIEDNAFTIMPSFGYFVSNNFAEGL